jgi:hypothetical protein
MCTRALSALIQTTTAIKHFNVVGNAAKDDADALAMLQAHFTAPQLVKLNDALTWTDTHLPTLRQWIIDLGYEDPLA